MSKIWVSILLVSCGVAIYYNPSIAIIAMTKGANDSVKLAIGLVAIYGLWLGVLNIMDRLGLSDKIAWALQPLVRLLFGKGLSKESNKYVSLNLSANFLGLGNAATPTGINAVRSMGVHRVTASNQMIMLVVVSATSLQLLPTTVIGMRINRGSFDPTSFLMPSIAATVVSTVVGVLLVKILQRIVKEKPN
jgi:spore maturation protein A